MACFDQFRYRSQTATHVLWEELLNGIPQIVQNAHAESIKTSHHRLAADQTAPPAFIPEKISLSNLAPTRFINNANAAKAMETESQNRTHRSNTSSPLFLIFFFSS